MEHVGSLAEGEWSCSLSGMYNTTEEADFMAQLLANPPLPSNMEGCSGLGDHAFWPACQESITDMTLGTQKSLCSTEMATNPSMFYFLQGSSNIHSGNFSSFLPTPTMSSGNYFLSDSHAIHVSNDSHLGMEFCNGDGKITSSYLAEENECMNQAKPECNVDQESFGQQQPESCIPEESSQDDKIPAVQVPDETMEEHTIVSGNRKRPRNAEKNKRTVRSRRNQKRGSTGGNEEENNAGKIGQTPSACCSDDDSNASQEHQGEPISPSDSAKDHQASALNSNGKSRASRGTATDPQSLYARKRRERINERLRILQGLVPNGTKVDISTMLEEAVQYVKFLQLQIKLLSSDDMWMYAPIAYNGMNLGLDLSIPTPPKRS